MINFNFGGGGNVIKMSSCQRKAKNNFYKKEEANSRIYNKETGVVSSNRIPVCSMIFFTSFGVHMFIAQSIRLLHFKRHDY